MATDYLHSLAEKSETCYPKQQENYFLSIKAEYFFPEKGQKIHFLSPTNFFPTVNCIVKVFLAWEKVNLVFYREKKL